MGDAQKIRVGNSKVRKVVGVGERRNKFQLESKTRVGEGGRLHGEGECRKLKSQRDCGKGGAWSTLDLHTVHPSIFFKEKTTMP
jgi:hypothetical protein